MTDKNISGISLKYEQEKFKAVFYGAEAPIVIFQGPEMVIEMLNEKYQAIYAGRELLGKSLFEAIPELKESRFPDVLKNVYETGEYFISHEGFASIYNVITEQFEERYFDATFSRIQYGNDKCYRIIATPREVTERVLSRKKLEASLLELEQERELREKFISALSHDLRTPLAVVKMSSKLLKRKASEPEAVKEMADRISVSMDRADRMIRDLLDANRINAGEGLPINIQECSLDLIVAYVVSDLEEIYGKKFQIKNEIGALSGYWDSMAIHRLIENLASNAIKYGSSAKEVTISLSFSNNWVEIAIHNEGKPIPLDEQKSLFNHYRRSTEAVKSGQRGWGIGLTLVKGLAEAHGGSVRVKSDLESGTTFCVHLPVDSRKLRKDDGI